MASHQPAKSGANHPPLAVGVEATTLRALRKAEQAALRPLSLAELRTRCRREFLNGSGSAETLVARLVEHRHPYPPPTPGAYHLLVHVVEGRFDAPGEVGVPSPRPPPPPFPPSLSRARVAAL
jgi:hypothetical protein